MNIFLKLHRPRIANKLSLQGDCPSTRPVESRTAPPPHSTVSTVAQQRATKPQPVPRTRVPSSPIIRSECVAPLSRRDIRYQLRWSNRIDIFNFDGCESCCAPSCPRSNNTVVGHRRDRYILFVFFILTVRPAVPIASSHVFSGYPLHRAYPLCQPTFTSIMSSCVQDASKKSVAIIGCGASGLAALKNFAADGSQFECVAFEQTESIGGTWVYTDDVDTDQYGLPVHSSMYKTLRSNLPKEIMELSGFPHKGVGDACYFPAAYILKYLNDFTDHFNLRQHIKFHHHVEKISPINNDQWEVNVIDLQQKSKQTLIFDALVVCVGNYSNPAIPNVKGADIFRGKIMHSHSYRDADPYEKSSVLVVGCGASGLDISFGVSKVAKKVCFSHHNPNLMKLKIPSNYFHKTDVKEIVEDGVVFQDGSYEQIDTIIYCTGYTYKYPFLSSDCGIHVENNVIKYLFKHMINIEYPTMGFIGVPRNTTGFYLFDLQSRIFKKILEGGVKLPGKKEMMEDTQKEINARLASGQRLKDLHALGKTKWAMEYYTSVTKFANVEHPPPVLLQIYFDGIGRLSEDFLNFRGDKYQIVDREHYEVKYFDKNEPIIKKQILYSF